MQVELVWKHCVSFTPIAITMGVVVSKRTVTVTLFEPTFLIHRLPSFFIINLDFVVQN